MGKLIISTATTVDAVMTVEEWFVAQGGHDAASRRQFENDAAMLLGRPTYEGLAAYWSRESGAWADLINPMPKYVASRTATGPLEWNATLIEGDVAEEVARLKREREGDLVSVGCGELAGYLIGEGLVDELRFWLHPAIWGSGERPFKGEERLRLEFLGSEAFDSGVTVLRYRPAG